MAHLGEVPIDQRSDGRAHLIGGKDPGGCQGLDRLAHDDPGVFRVQGREGQAAQDAVGRAEMMIGPVSVSYTHLTLPTKRIV